MLQYATRTRLEKAKKPFSKGRIGTQTTPTCVPAGPPLSFYLGRPTSSASEAYQ